MMWSADPLGGWDLEEVTAHSKLKNDIYGGLYQQLEAVLDFALSKVAHISTIPRKHSKSAQFLRQGESGK